MQRLGARPLLPGRSSVLCLPPFRASAPSTSPARPRHSATIPMPLRHWWHTSPSSCTARTLHPANPHGLIPSRSPLPPPPSSPPTHTHTLTPTPNPPPTQPLHSVVYDECSRRVYVADREFHRVHAFQRGTGAYHGEAPAPSPLGPRSALCPPVHAPPRPPSPAWSSALAAWQHPLAHTRRLLPPATHHFGRLILSLAYPSPPSQLLQASGSWATSMDRPTRWPSAPTESCWR